MNATVQLLDPNGNPLPIDSVTVTESVNEGWTWSATLAQVPRYAGDMSLTDAFQSEAFRFFLSIESNGVTLALPPLVATGYEEDVSGGGSVSGVDEATYLLTRRRGVLTGSGATSSASILASAAYQVDLSGVLIDYIDWYFNIEEVEQSGITAMLPHVNRICDIACQEWVSQLGAGGTCDVRFYPLDIEAAPGSWQPDWSRVVRRRDTASRVSSMHIVRCGRMGDSIFIPGHKNVGYMVPLNSWVVVQCPYQNVTLFAAGGTTELGGGGVYTAGPDDPACEWLRIDEVNPDPFYVRGRARGNVLDRPVSARLTVDGMPGNKADETWEEDWMPNAGYIAFMKDQYLWRANRSTHTLEWEGPLCPGLHLGQVLTWSGHPNSRVETYTHTISTGAISTRATSAVLAADQW